MAKIQPIAVVLTDTHLKKGNEELVMDIFKQAVTLCKKLKVNRLLHAGDFFTSRNAQPLEVLSIADNIFRMIKEEGIMSDIIPGNHDKTDLESEASYLDVFRELCAVHRDYAQISLGGMDIHFLPYFKENTVYGDKLSKIKVSKKSKNILITHTAVTGVRNNDGSEVNNNLSPEMFKQFDEVLVGHYHNKSAFNNITYIGSAYQSNFGEDSDKGFTIINSDGSLDFIQSKFPEYIKVKLSATDKGQLKEVKKQLANSPDHVRLIIEGTEAECKSLNKDQFTALGIDVKFEKEESRIMADQEFVSFDRANIREHFEEFCSRNNFENIEIGREYLGRIL